MRILRIAEEHFRSHFAQQAAPPHIRSDPDNRKPAVRIGVVIEADTLPDRVFVGPEPASHGLIDDRHFRRISGVLDGKLATGQQRDSHRVKIAGTHDVEVGGVSSPRVRVRLGFDTEGLMGTASERQIRNQGGGFDPGQDSHPSEDLIEK